MPSTSTSASARIVPEGVAAISKSARRSATFCLPYTKFVTPALPWPMSRPSWRLRRISALTSPLIGGAKGFTAIQSLVDIGELYHKVFPMSRFMGGAVGVFGIDSQGTVAAVHMQVGIDMPCGDVVADEVVVVDTPVLISNHRRIWAYVYCRGLSRRRRSRRLCRVRSPLRL